MKRASSTCDISLSNCRPTMFIQRATDMNTLLAIGSVLTMRMSVALCHMQHSTLLHICIITSTAGLLDVRRIYGGTILITMPSDRVPLRSKNTPLSLFILDFLPCAVHPQSSSEPSRRPDIRMQVRLEQNRVYLLNMINDSSLLWPKTRSTGAIVEAI